MLESLSDNKYKPPEIFIVSSGRSGTTLLVSILNATQQIFIPYESDFIARAYPLYADRDAFSEADYAKLIDIFYRSSQPQGWNLEKVTYYNYLCDCKPQNFADVHSAISEVYHAHQGTTDLIWGIKAPVLIASIDRIRAVYPNSKIVHIIRDGRDVYLSYKKVHDQTSVKFGPKTLLENALYWVDGLRRIERYRGTHHVFELRYENLLGNPEGELKQLSDFLGIDYDPIVHENFASFEKNRVLVPENLADSLHHKVKGGLDSSNRNKYKQRMSVSARLVYEFLTLPYLHRYDYDIEFPWLRGLAPLRSLLYSGARLINNWRYSRRDYNIRR